MVVDCVAYVPTLTSYILAHPRCLYTCDTRMHVSTKCLIKTDTRGDIERAGRDERRDWPHNGVCEGARETALVP